MQRNDLMEPATSLGLAAFLSLLMSIAPLQAQIVTTVAGGLVGDGLPATQAGLSQPWSVAVDRDGKIYFSERSGHRIRMVDLDGVVHTVAGNGLGGYGGHRTNARFARLIRLLGVAVDGDGRVLFADSSNFVLRRIGPDGSLTNVAGTPGSRGYAGDGGPALEANLFGMASVAVGADGGIFVADDFSNVIRQISPNGIISTFAGTTRGFSGDGGPASAAQLSRPLDVALDSMGRLYIADAGNRRVRRVNLDGSIETVAGGGNGQELGERATEFQFFGSSPDSVLPHPDGSFFVVSQGQIFRIDIDGNIHLYAGVRGSGFNGDGRPAEETRFSSPSDLALGADGALLVADSGNDRIRRIDPDTRVVQTIAGGAVGDGNPAFLSAANVRPSFATFSGPPDFDCSGNLYFADTGNHRIRRIDSLGIISTLAGIGVQGSEGLGGPAAAANLTSPTAVRADCNGNVYVLESSRLLRIDQDRMIAQVAGVGGFRMDLDLQGNILVGDANRGTIDRVSPDGSTARVAGQDFCGENSGNGGPAVDACFGYIWGLAVDSQGRIYAADNEQIRVIGDDGVINGFAGNGEFGVAIDGTPAVATPLVPLGVAVDSNDSVWTSDGSRILRVDPDGILHVEAGSLEDFGFSGEGVSADVGFGLVLDLNVDSSGNVYFVEDERIRRLQRAGLEDSDGDGLIDEIENRASNDGDGNSDAAADRVQSHIASALNAVDGASLTLASAEGTAFRNVQNRRPPAVESVPDGAGFPFEIWNFELEGIEAGGSAEVELLLPDGQPIDAYHQYGATPDNPDPHWYEFSFDGQTGAEILADRVILHYRDGLRGDADLSANGRLEAQGGPAAFTASHKLYFAQFGDGGGAIFSQIYLLSLDGAGEAVGRIRLRGDSGAALEVDLDGAIAEGGVRDAAVPAAGLRGFRTDGEGPVQAGWASVISDRALEGVILFGGSAGVAGVGSSRELENGFLAPLELNSASAIGTGVAAVNLGDAPCRFDLSLTDAEGRMLATAQEELAAGGHFSLFANQFQWSDPIDFSDFLGTLGAVANCNAAATVIQTRPGEFATLPVVPRGSAPAGETAGAKHPGEKGLSPNQLYFAQFGDGAGLLFSQIFLLNPDPSNPASAAIELRNDQGEPLSVDLNGELVEGRLENVVVPPSGLRVFRTDGIGDVVAGSVVVTSDRELAGVVLFGGNTGVAGVGASVELPQGFLAPVETSSSAQLNTGVAVMNLDQETCELDVELSDAEGAPIAQAAESLVALGHRALFVDQFDWDSEVDFSDFRGILTIDPSCRTAATVIQTRPAQLATLPVAARASGSPAAAGLRR